MPFRSPSLAASLRSPCCLSRSIDASIAESATLDAQLFQRYLDAAIRGGGDRAKEATPLVKISGRAHPVAEYFLEDVVAATGYVAAACGGGDREIGRRDEGAASIRVRRQETRTDAELGMFHLDTESYVTTK